MSDTQASAPIIDMQQISMRFNLPKEKVDSLKEWFIRKLKGAMSIEEFYALRDVNLKVEKGDVYGIVGLNGSGKSTLLKIVAGVMKPTRGVCRVNGTVAPLIELGAGFDMDLTARENIYLNGHVLGMDKKYIDSKFDEVVEFSELHEFLDVALKNFSSGMVARLAFSVATVMQPDILIVDEILSVGDFLFQQKSEARMLELMNGGATVLMVSHGIEQIERLCNKAVWLNKGKVIMDGECKEVCHAYKTKANKDDR